MFAQSASRERIGRAPVAAGKHVAEAIAVAMCKSAADTSVAAAKEIIERTEGRVPATVSVEGRIDYAAGQTAKEQLMRKLGSADR